MSSRLLLCKSKSKSIAINEQKLMFIRSHVAQIRRVIFNVTTFVRIEDPNCAL